MKCAARLLFTPGNLFSGLLFAVLLSISACKARTGSAASTGEGSEVFAVAERPAVHLLGSYVGSFGKNKITLLITKAVGDSIEGRSVVGGNDRPFNGIVQQAHGKYNVVAKEPGGEVHDGTFYFSIDAQNPDLVNGTWEPYVPTTTLTGKQYSLHRKAFEYSKNAGNYPEASQRLLIEDDINNLTTAKLELMRNEIFARHGYCFKKKHLRQLFEDKEWYVPNTAEVKNMLTDTERKNISLIKKYEQYAEEYGDEFGR